MRFTEKFKDGRNILRSGIEHIHHVGFGYFYTGDAIEKLAEYETAEEEGRLVVLPCKVGDTVWMVHQILTSTVNNVISKMPVTELRGNRLNPIWFAIDGEYGRTSFHPSEIGKTVFLTREEAEKALKKMEGKQNE